MVRIDLKSKIFSYFYPIPGLVCMDVRRCVGVCGLAWVCVDMCGSARVYTEVHGTKCVCVWDESLEYLLETRILTSADFNTYLNRFFFYKT